MLAIVTIILHFFFLLQNVNKMKGPNSRQKCCFVSIYFKLLYANTIIAAATTRRNDSTKIKVKQRYSVFVSANIGFYLLIRILYKGDFGIFVLKKRMNVEQLNVNWEFSCNLFNWCDYKQ